MAKKKTNPFKKKGFVPFGKKGDKKGDKDKVGKKTGKKLPFKKSTKSKKK